MHHYKSKTKAISFSTDRDIAKAFAGNEYVIETFFTKNNLYLEFIPELDFILSQIRNLKQPMTQKEVILLPEFDIEFKVIKIPQPFTLW